MNEETLFIVGGNSTAFTIRETVELYEKNKYNKIYNVIGNGEQSEFDFVQDQDLDILLSQTKHIRYILGFTNIELKYKFRQIFDKFGGIPENVIHPSACIFPSATIGKGNYIAAYAIISSKAIIGNSNLINYSVSIGHDTIVGNDCVFNPGARIGGCSEIGNCCLFGANSFVYQGTKITNDCKIDACVYLHKHLYNPVTIRNINRIQ